MENSFQPIPVRLYINRSRPVVTYVLAALNVLAYAADAASEYVWGYPVLTYYGAKINALIAVFGQWWRLASPMFLHGSLSHIALNTVALVIWGRQAEALLGRGKYIAVYLASGVMGAACSFAFSPAASVGASGAIFGLFGALLALRSTHREIFNRVFGVQVLLIIGINVVNGFITPGIDNFAHIGGLMGGYAACCATGFYRAAPRRGRRVIFILIGAGLLAGFILWGLRAYRAA